MNKHQLEEFLHIHRHEYPVMSNLLALLGIMPLKSKELINQEIIKEARKIYNDKTVPFILRNPIMATVLHLIEG